MPTIAEIVGSRIQTLRKARLLTQTQLGDRVEVAQHTLSRIENGLMPPSLDLLVRLAEVLEVPPSTLLDPAPPAVAPGDPVGALVAAIPDDAAVAKERIRKALRALAGVDEGRRPDGEEPSQGMSKGP